MRQPADPFRSPDRYLYVFQDDTALFLPVDRGVYRRSIFLDERIALASGEIVAVPVAAFAALPPPPRTGWIFHVAHCGSTLLARALDAFEDALVLREPLPLRQLGVEACRGARGAGWTARLRLATAMVARRYAPETPTIVKANVPVNFILPDLLADDPQAPAILLYHPFEAYLLAVLRSEGHRGWIGHVTGELAPTIESIVGPLDGLAVAERAAALWLLQIRAFSAVLARCPYARSLDATALFARPAPVLRAACSLYGITAGDAAIDAVAAGPIFSTYAKDPALAFNNAMRAERAAVLAQTLRPEIDRARLWLDRQRAALPLPDRLTAPLIGEAPSLLA